MPREIRKKLKLVFNRALNVPTELDVLMSVDKLFH